jgi:putative endonuclease
MYTVYILYSAKFNKIYIGFTSDIDKRLESHNILATKGWTIKFRPWVLVYTEVYHTKAEALQREKQLKTAKGRAFVWERINSTK